MKRLKKFYKNNRIYCILMLVSLLCFILMGSAVVIYFIHQASSSPYGPRLDHIDEYPAKEEVKNLEKYFNDEASSKNATARIQGKIIYVTVEVDSKTSLEDIQKMAVGSLDKLMDDQKAYYDIQFTFTRDGLPAYQGSKSSTKTVITWANYDLSSLDITTTTTSTTTSKKKK